MRAVTNATCFSALVSFFAGPVQVSSTLLLMFYFPAYSVTLGRYLIPLLYSTSLINFVTFSVFMRDFRRELAKLFGCKQHLAGDTRMASHMVVVSAMKVQPVSARGHQTTMFWFIVLSVSIKILCKFILSWVKYNL